MGATFLLALAVIIPVALFIAYLVIRVRYKKAGPDEALIVFGRRKLFGLEHPPRHSIQFRQHCGIACLGRGNHGVIEHGIER